VTSTMTRGGEMADASAGADPAKAAPAMTDIGPAGPGLDGTAQDGDHMEAAARLRSERPGWVVVWSVPLRRFSASPLFRAPSGTFLTAGTLSELADQMNQVEQAASSRGVRSRYLDR
jgi:hypothetical protein